jgi:hypothetical protein
MRTTSSGKRLLVEAVVVVVSILLAFAIDAGWDQRQARQDERAVLRGLQSELLESRLIIESSRRNTAQAYERLKYFLAAPRSELLALSPVAAVGEVFQPLTRQWDETLPRGALDAATGSGKLASISDPALRAALARLGGAHASVKEMTAVIGEMDARTVAVLGELEGIQAIFAMPEPELDSGTLGALRDDPKIMGATTAKIWFLGGYLYQLQLLEATIDENLELIAAVLDN